MFCAYLQGCNQRHSAGVQETQTLLLFVGGRGLVMKDSYWFRSVKLELRFGLFTGFGSENSVFEINWQFYINWFVRDVVIVSCLCQITC